MEITDIQKQLHLDLLHSKYYFDIELTSNCNLKCSFCPRESIERNYKNMPSDVMNLLPDWLPENSNVMFAGMGEPFLNDHIFDIINKIANNQRIIGVTTNGHLINKDMIDRLFDSKLNFLQISINELENNKYKIISGGKDNKELLNTIKQISIKNKSKNIQLQFSFVSDNITEQEIQSQQIFSADHNSNYFSKKIHNRGGYINHKSDKKFNTCYLFSQVTFINSDGNILYCCHDLPAESIIGHISKNTFKEIMDKKTLIIDNNKWLRQCDLCNDEGRKEIIN